MPETEKETRRPYVVIVQVDADPEQAFGAISDAAFTLSESAQIVGGYDCIERIEAAAKAEAGLNVRRTLPGRGEDDDPTV